MGDDAIARIRFQRINAAEQTIAQKVPGSMGKLVSVGNSIIDDLNGLIR